MSDNKNKYQESLASCRKSINEIDEKILNLLKSRIKIIDKVSKIKTENNEKFFIKSAREADMIKSLLKKNNNEFCPISIISIWRKIITASNMLEQPISIALHNPKKISDYKYILKEYYSELVKINEYNSIANVVNDIEKNICQIAIFILDEDEPKEDIYENWWISLANNKSGIKLFAKIPLYQNNSCNYSLYAFAVKDSEESQSDKTILYVEVKPSYSKNQIIADLKNAKINARILKNIKIKQFNDIAFYLIEVDGFFLEEDIAIKTFKDSTHKPFVKILGSYAKPIEI